MLIHSNVCEWAFPKKEAIEYTAGLETSQHNEMAPQL